mmetsp:Transcript_28682/g.72634  ORF Transcript_28682/g.72634 Transcript_28682/m.72634 type:complete len:105 (+) Transcript_28682:171-485(+)|eukprot:g4368.t1
MPHYPDEIEYSEKYQDDTYEYRHVILPKHIAKKMYASFGYGNKNTRTLLSEEQWRGLGVQQSRGWCHYECHRPEPHILLFRRPLGTNPLTGIVEDPSQSNQLHA